MLPDEMEAEKNRKIILAQSEEIEILKRNVRDLQKQLNDSYIRIKELNDKEVIEEKHIIPPDGTGHGPAMVDVGRYDDGWADEIDIQIMSTSRGHNQ